MKKLAIAFLVSVVLVATFAGARADTTRVVGYLPSGSLESARDAGAVSVMFDRPVVPVAALSAEPVTTGPFTLDPPVPGTFHYLGTRSVEFRPYEPLPRATAFTVRVPRELPTLDGWELEDDLEWEFETPRPRLLAVAMDGIGSRPWDDPAIAWVAPESDVLLWFDQPIELASVTGVMELVRECEIGALSEDCADGATEPEPVTGFWSARYATEEELALEERGNIDGHDWVRAVRVYQDRPEDGAMVILSPPVVLDESCRYHLTVGAGVEGRDGDLASAESFGLPVLTRGDLCFAGLGQAAVDEVDGPFCPAPADVRGNGPLNPDHGFTMLFSNPVNRRELAGALAFEPELGMPDDIDAYDTPLARFWVDLEPDTQYRVAVRETLSDVYGNALGSPVSFAFRTGDYSQSVRVETGYRVVERLGRHAIPLTLRNPEPMRLRMARIGPADIVDVCAREELWSSRKQARGGDALRFTVDGPFTPEIERNKSEVVWLDLDEALGSSASGIVFVELAVGRGNETSYRKAVVQVTDLGLTCKVAPERTLVWVSSLDSGEPLEGVTIDLRDNDDTVLWRGRTRGDGTVEGPGWMELAGEREDSFDRDDLWIVAHKGVETAFVAPSYAFKVPTFRLGIWSAYSVEPSSVESSVFSDQGIYRPGDEVRLKGIVRARRLGGDWRVPEGLRLRLRVKDALGDQVMSDSLTVGAWGSFDASFDLGEDASLGHYSVRSDTFSSEKSEWVSCSDISGSFRVAAFRPAEFEVAVTTDGDEAVRGDTCAATVAGSYLFGGPMAGAPLSWHAHAYFTFFSPPGLDGFTFGPLERPRGRQGLGPVARGETDLDAAGRADIRVPTGGTANLEPVSLVISASAMSPSRQEVVGEASVLVHPAAFYAGVRLSSTIAEEGKPHGFAVVAVRPDGEPDPGRELNVRVVQRQWHSVRKAGVNGRYRWVTETKDTLIDSISVRSAEEPVELETAPPSAGFYVVIVRGEDGQGNTVLTDCPFYVSGSGYAAWERRDDDTIELVADAERYEPGETARILVKSPYEGARALVSIERERVLQSWTTELVGTAPEIEIPIEEEYLPNVYVSVMLVSGRTAPPKPGSGPTDPGRPALKIGYVELKVDPSSKRLALDVATDRETYEPGETVTVDIDVSDANGDAADAEVVIAVVDEGVLNLTGHRLPDPFERFYRRRALAVDLRTLYQQIVEQPAEGEKGESTSGDGGGAVPGLSIRGEFSSSAYWNPSVETDRRGHVRVSFELPDNLTSWRVMAVAHTRDAAFGRGESSFRTRKPFMVQPSLPRFARQGDEFVAGVVAHNQSGEAGEVVIEATARGLEIAGVAKRQLRLMPGESREVTFPLVADEAGEATVEFRARLATDDGRSMGDAFTLDIPVHPPLACETVATAGVTDGSSTETLVVPEDALPGAGGLAIEVSSTVLQGLEEGVEYLRDYPYACVEQRVSSVLPWILGADVIEAFGLSGMPEGEAERRVQDNLDLLSGYQQRDGGFAYWPSSRVVHPYATAYAAWAMIEARDAGYRVDGRSLDDALEYLRSFLRRKIEPDDRYGIGGAHRATEAFAVFVLARAGTPEPEQFERLYETRSELPVFARALMLRAAVAGGEREAVAGELLRDLNNRLRVTPTEAHIDEPGEDAWWWCWHTPTRTTAMVLGAMLEVEPDHPMAAPMARWLLGARRDGRWSNTQENVYAFDAIARYFALHESEEPDFDAVVRLAGGTVLAESFRGRNAEPAAVELGLDGVQRGAAVPVRFEKDGEGTLYYTMRMEYCSSEPFPPRDEGLFVMREVAPVDSTASTEGGFEAGSMLRVSLRIEVPAWRTYVVVDDPLPAGFEAVDRSLKTEDRALWMALGEERGGRRSAFDHVEMRDDRVLLFADWLEPGVHEFSYLVRTITRGTFDAPATTAMQMYAPEVFGRGDGGSVTVR